MSQQLTDLNQQITITIFVCRPTHNGMTVKDYADGIVSGTHSTLDHAEFETMFGASDSDIDSVVQFLEQTGLTVIYSHCCAASVIATGTVGQINSAFGITLIDVTTPERTYMIYDGAIILPNNLNNIIDHIDGLDTSAYVVPMNNFRAAVATPGYNTRLVKPQVAATAYNFPGNNDGTDGVGQVIAVVQPWNCGYTQQNLNSTFAAYGITGTTVVDYLLDGKTNNPSGGTVSGTNSEVMLDIAMAAGIVPKATVVVYICNTVQSALNAILYDPQNKGYLPKIVSISVGGAEGTHATTTADTLLAQAAVLGVTVIVSSGDWGPYNGPVVGYAYRSYGASWPSSSPYVLSIGGTSLILNPNGSIASEVTWNNNGEDYFITGGNTSTRYAAPSWQTGITLKDYATGVSSTPTGRATPDVALVADPYTGFTYFYYASTSSTNVSNNYGGGTSASAPLWAGLIARINQLKGTSVGFINTTLYSNPTVFHDILPTVSANNNAYLGVGFSTTQGWDATTGLGSPNGTALTALFVVSASPPVTSPTYQNVDYNSLSTVINLNVNGIYDHVYIAVNAIHGVLTINDLVVTYKPNRGYHGLDTFNFYTDNAAGNSNISRVTLTILDPELTLTPDALPNGKIGQTYLINLTVFGGQAPYFFEVWYGDLPEGIKLVNNTLVGTPKYPGIYNFGILASDSSYPAYVNVANDYDLQIDSKINFSWLTNQGQLVNPAEPGSFISAALVVTANSDPIFTVISGSLPKGCQLTQNGANGVISGFVQGSIYPVTYNFVIRAYSKLFRLSVDRSFSIAVLPFAAPVWSYNTATVYLQGPNADGTYKNYQYVKQQLIANAPIGVGSSPYNITYSLSTSGTLPAGVNIYSTGTLNGFIKLDVSVLPNVDTKSYNFRVLASNGYRSTPQNFVMTVTSVNSTFQDPTFLQNPYLGAFQDNSYEIIPVFAYAAFPVFGPVIYQSTAGNIPSSMSLDTTSGFIYGVIDPQPNYLTNYEFLITANRYNPYEDEYASASQYFSMDIFQKNSDRISWVTTSSLGIIPQFVPSTLKIVAAHTQTIYDLQYFSVGNDLPNGLVLDTNGDILGVPISTGTYTISVVATTGTIYNAATWNSVVTSKTYPVAAAYKSFDLKISNTPLKYTNIYARLFLPRLLRLEYQRFISNTTVFEPNLIYRKEDVNFGVQKDFKMYLHYGIQQFNTVHDYSIDPPISDQEKIFYTGKIMYQSATDDQGIPLFDVVYLDILDHNQGKQILNKIRQELRYKSNAGINFDYYPYWQKSAIIDQTKFIFGVVLCYALPGKAVQIIANFKQYFQSLGHFELNNIDFTIDRLVFEQTLSSTSSSYLILL